MNKTKENNDIQTMKNNSKRLKKAKSYNSNFPYVNRSGVYDFYGSIYPASYRYDDSTSNANSYYGARLALY